jgi:transposase-like protein
MGKLAHLEEQFAGRHFDREVIILCVRWYLRFKLSLRDLVEMMAERGLSLAHTTIMRWVQHYTHYPSGQFIRMCAVPSRKGSARRTCATSHFSQFPRSVSRVLSEP